MKTNNRMGVVLSDVHCPFEDKSVCRMALAFIREHRPATVHLLGDIADFYSVSRFVKDPSRKEDLQADLDTTRAFLAKVRDAAPAARIVYSEGNHEFRLRRYLASEAKALAMLRDLRLERLLDFESLKIRFQPQDRPYRVGSLLAIDGIDGLLLVVSKLHSSLPPWPARPLRPLRYNRARTSSAVRRQLLAGCPRADRPRHVLLFAD